MESPPKSTGWTRSAQEAAETRDSAAGGSNGGDVVGRLSVPEIRAFIGSLVGLTSIWAIVALTYYIKASQSLSFFGTCGPGAGPSGGMGQEGNWAGAGYSSATAGAALGGVLWAAAAVAA